MKLSYENKESEASILANTKAAVFDGKIGGGNLLIHGDNLNVLQALRASFSGKIDLIYIDPPFSTNTVYRVGSERTGTVSFSSEDDVAYRDDLGGSEYLESLRKRLIITKELLSPRGSIYLHIDYKIGHYVKVLMDEIFGRANFRNDITRIKCNPKNFSRQGYGNMKDLILFYSNGSDPIWNEVRIPLDEQELHRLFRKIDKDGRRYTTIPLHAPGETKSGVTGEKFKGLLPPKGRHWRSSPKVLEELDEQGLIEWSKNGVPRKIIYADEHAGKKLQDIWEFKDPQYPTYPTEKNLQLLKTIVAASSNMNSIVLDFYCGSGTTLLAAQELGRRWIGIDESLPAIETAKERLGSAYQLLKQIAIE
ncbi:MAG TPA: site-specific DNA-methyltransferase [Sphaerochaeta sp.]|jgi:adenine-specific DNA-methyltransferase|nr:site-specific DNA-methyltransferase [Sphaerochaeta sp.]